MGPFSKSPLRNASQRCRRHTKNSCLFPVLCRQPRGPIHHRRRLRAKAHRKAGETYVIISKCYVWPQCFSVSRASVLLVPFFSVIIQGSGGLVAGFSLASMLSVFVSSPFSGEALFKDFHFPLFNRLVQRRLLFLCFLSPVGHQSFVSLYYLMQRCSPLRDVILKSFIMLCYHLVCC